MRTFFQPCLGRRWMRFVCVGGAVWRPQGGGGIDHPRKVQQKKTQTHKRFSRCVVFSDPRGTSHLFYGGRFRFFSGYGGTYHLLSNINYMII